MVKHMIIWKLKAEYRERESKKKGMREKMKEGREEGTEEKKN